MFIEIQNFSEFTISTNHPDVKMSIFWDDDPDVGVKYPKDSISVGYEPQMAVKRRLHDYLLQIFKCIN
jgi:hypothetical protein